MPESHSPGSTGHKTSTIVIGAYRAYETALSERPRRHLDATRDILFGCHFRTGRIMPGEGYREINSPDQLKSALLERVQQIGGPPGSSRLNPAAGAEIRSCQYRRIVAQTAQ